MSEQITTDQTTKPDGTFNEPGNLDPSDSYMMSEDDPAHGNDPDNVLVDRDDLAFMLAEIEGSLTAAEAMMADKKEWQKIIDSGLQEWFEADMARIEYILERYADELPDYE